MSKLPKRHVADTPSVFKLSMLAELPQKKLLAASIFLHLVFFSLLFVNWQTHEPIKQIHIPQHIEAQMIAIEDVQALQNKKAEEQRLLELQQERLKQEALEKKRLKELERQKIQEHKKREAEKALKLKKEKEEQAKKLKDKQAKEKRETEQKRLAQEKKKQAEEKAKIAEQKRIEELKAAELKSQEAKMLEKLKQLEKQNRLAEELAKAKKLEEDRLQAEKQFQAYELSEKDKYTARIRAQIESVWRTPPKSDGLRIVLTIKLLPNGELVSVNIEQSSGNTAFDNSAMLAVNSVRRFLVPDDNRVFERNFRVFNMAFSPE